MDSVQRVLMEKQARETLAPADVCEGMVACFLLINREFIRRRMGKRPDADVDAMTRQLIDDVFANLGISPQNPTLAELREARRVLDDQLGFEAEPDLLQRHSEIVGALFRKAPES